MQVGLPMLRPIKTKPGSLYKPRPKALNPQKKTHERPPTGSEVDFCLRALPPAPEQDQLDAADGPEEYHKAGEDRDSKQEAPKSLGV